MAKQKFYVVWEGVTPGVYTSWTDCQLQIKGYEAAKYKSFDTREEAERALTMSPYAYIGKNAKAKSGGPKPSSDTLYPQRNRIHDRPAFKHHRRVYPAYRNVDR